jgi:RHS repeat-associated protein
MLVMAALWVQSAHAEPPSVKLQTSSLVSPQQAWAYFTTATTHTSGLAATGATAPEIVELANSLRQGGACTGACYASEVYQYVRNNIAVEFRFGLGKGGRGALIDQSGTPFDQAHLMVDLLTQGGVSASYQLGTITLNGTQFQQWTGMTNAPGACQFLADGGMPATVNGASSCTSLAAGTAVSSVVVGHIWVVATIGGTSVVYDPSYKIHVVKAGIGYAGLASAMGCSSTSCASGILNFVPQPTGSSVAGVNQIQGVQRTNIEGQLTAYAISLENYIKQQNQNNYTTANPNMQVEDLVGGATIDTSQPIPSGTTISPLPASSYAPNSAFLWNAAADIPDQFRTTLTVKLGQTGALAINSFLYADEIAGSRLRLINHASGGSATTSNVATDLYSEYMLLAAGTLPNVDLSGAVPLVLSVCHPYANPGTYDPLFCTGYAGESLQYNLLITANYCTGVPGCIQSGGWYSNQVTIVQGWGEATESTVAHIAALIQRDQTHVPAETIAPNNTAGLTSSMQIRPKWRANKGATACEYITPVPTTPTTADHCYFLGQAQLAANWLAQSSRAAQLVAAVNGTVRQMHHSLGIVVSGDALAGGNTLISIQTSLSINVNTSSGSVSDRAAAFSGTAAALSRLEGSVMEQSENIWEGGDAVSMMVKSNENNIPFWDLNYANASSASPSLGNYDSTFFGTYIQPYIDVHYDVIMPQQGQVGKFCGYGGCSNSSIQFLFNGLVAFGPNGDRIAYDTDAAGFDKGAGGASDPVQMAVQQTTIHDYSTKKRNVLSIDSMGGVALNPPPDLITGDGDFPYSLSYQRVYSSGNTSYGCESGAPPGVHCRRNEAEPSALPIGWTHTLAITARLTSDGFASFGRSSALDASATIAALLTARQLYLASGAIGSAAAFRANVANIFVVNWLGNNLQANVVAVSRPPRKTAFTLLPDGIYNPEPGNAEVLTQTGGVRSLVAGGSPGGSWSNEVLAFSLRGKGGDTLNFGFGSAYSNQTIYLPTTWKFPTGVTVSFNYSSFGCIQEYSGQLISVTNNLGRSLTFTNICDPYYGAAKFGTPLPLTTTVTDDNGRAVSLSLLPSTLSVVGSGDNPEGVAGDDIKVTGLTATAPDGAAISEYDYVPSPSTNINRAYYKIYQWLTPGDRTNPFETVTFDSLYRASSVKDNTSASCCVTQYWSAGLYGVENQKLQNTVDPLGAVTTRYFDRWGSVIQSVDPLNRVTSYVYDTFRRKFQEFLPELNGYSYHYDVRHNLLSTTRNPKPGSSLATTTASTSYVVGPTVSAGNAACVSTAACDRPYQETDANLNTTTYSWDSTTGLMTNIQYPQVPTAIGGTNLETPNTALAYTTCSYAGGSPVTVLLSKTERVWQGPTPAPQNLVTQYNYNASDNCLLQSVTLDQGGLNLTTYFVYDNGSSPGPGNLTTVQDPNGGTTSYRYDSLRRLVEIGHPLSVKTLYTYDLDGQLTSTQNWDSTRNAYQTELRGYYPTGDLAYVIGANANPTAPAQGASTTLVAGASPPCPGNFVTCYQYDSDGRQVWEQAPLTASTSRVNSTVYDLDGEVICTFRGWTGTSPAQQSNCTGWNPQAYGASSAVRYNFMPPVTFPNGSTPQCNYSLNGQTLCGYSGNGKVTAVLDADGNVTQNVYDGFDRLSQMILPGTTPGSSAPCHSAWVSGDNCEIYGYDNNDNMNSKRNRSGHAIATVYDPLNREQTRTVPANSLGHFARTVQTAYDLMGHVTTASVTGADIQTLTYNYDTAMRVKSEQDSLLGTASFVRDANGNRTQLNWPGTSYYATFAYDLLNRLCKVRENGPVTYCAMSDAPGTNVAQYTWDTLSRRQGITFQNGVTEGWTYYNDSAINTMAHTIGAKSIGITLGRNQVDQITSDALAVTDPSGAMTPSSFIRPPASASTAYIPNSLNEYASIGAVTASYDLNGNLTADGTFTYEYDEENRLRSATGPHNVTYQYDPVGRRHSKTVDGTVTQYLSENDEEIGEYTASGTPLRYYLNGHAIDEHLAQVEASGTHYYYSTNQQGSVLAATDVSQAISTFDYDPYGVSAPNPTGVAFRYTGRRFDAETGLYYYRARYYSPTLGRFLQTDPIGTKDDLDLYAYVGDDPLDRTDPMGLGAWDDFEWGVASGAGGALHRAGMDLPGGNEVKPGPNVNPNSRWATIGTAFGAVAAGFSQRQLSGLTPVAREGAAASAVGADAGNIRQNAAQGKAGEAMTRASLGDTIAGEQVTFKTSDGTRTRVDFVTKDNTVVETKTGNGDLSTGQAKMQADIAARRAVTPVGKKAENAGLVPNQPIVMKCFKVDRPC